MPKPLPGEKPMFTGTLDCALKTIRNEVSSQNLFSKQYCSLGQLVHFINYQSDTSLGLIEKKLNKRLIIIFIGHGM